MARNSVQFQKGLSLPDFLAAYGTERQCHDALVKMKWPDRFRCPECGHQGHCHLEKRKLFQCNRCHHQTSVRAGTIYHGSGTPLTKWFLASYLITQSKNTISTLSLSRQIGVKWDTAYRIRHKFCQVMLERDREKKLKGRIEIDDAYMGGENPGGKRGRGSENKAPFIAVVETTPGGEPVRIHLRCVEGFSKAALSSYAAASLDPACIVFSDGLNCFTAVKNAGCKHRPKTTGGGLKSVRNATFKWVNTVLGNLKTAISGTLHSVSQKYLPRYLAEFEYRFNRRYKLGDMIERLAWVGLRTPPMPEKFLKMAEPMG